MADETKIIRIIVDSSKAVDGSAAATQALEKLERSTASMDTTLARMERGLSSLGGAVKAQLALMVAELGARFIQMGKDSLKAVAGLDELAEQLGVTTKFLQASQFAAVQSGVKLEQLETAYSKFSQKMGEAADGSKDMVEALDKLGVKNLDVAGKLRPTEALMQDVAEAIIKIEDPARRSAAAVDFFGKAGTRMLPMLADIAAGADVMATKAAAAGAMIDDKVIKSLDKLADQSEVSALKFRALIATIGAPIATDAMEVVNSILGKIIANLKALGAMRDQSEQGVLPGEDLKMLQDRADFWNKKAATERNNARTQTMAERANTALQNATRNAGSVENPADRVQITQDQYATQLLVSGTFAPTEPLTAPGAKLSGIKGAGQAEADRIAKLERDTTREVEAATAYATASERGAKAVADLEIHFKALKAAQDAYGNTADKNTGQVGALTAKIEEQMKAAERLKSLKDFNLGTEELERANELLAAENALVNASVETRARELALIKLKHEVQSKGLDATNPKEKEAIDRRGEAIAQNERLKAQGDELKRANELWTEPLKNALNSIQSTAADMFDSMLERGAFSFQELGNFATKMVRRMIAEFAALAVIRPMLGSLMGGLQGIGLVSPSTASSLGYGGGMGGSSFPMMGGGGGGMFDFLSNPITPMSYGGAGSYDSIGQLISSGTPGALGGLTWGGALAGIGSIGMGAYSMATSKSTAGTIGGGLSMLGGGIGMASAAGLLPMLGAAGGPIGMGLGMAGMLLPMLFGGGETPALPPLAGASTQWGWNPATGGYNNTESTQNGGASIKSQYGSIAERQAALYAMAGGVNNPGGIWGNAIWQNYRENQATTYLIDPSGNSTQWGQGSNAHDIGVETATAQSAYRSLIGGVNLSPNMRQALEPMNGRIFDSIDQLEQIVAEVRNFDDALKSIKDKAPSFKATIEQINSSFAALFDTAARYGFDASAFTAEKDKQTKRAAEDFIDSMLDPMAVQMRALEDQRADSLASAEYIRDNVKSVYVDMARIAEYWTKKEADLKEQAYSASVTSLQNLIKRLTYGDLANASPDTSLSGTRANYSATLAQARAGNADAINGLAGSAESYATSARSYFASSAEYAAIVEQIRRDLEAQVGVLGGNGGGTAANNNEATNAVLQSNAELRSMFAESMSANAQLREQLSVLTAQMQRMAQR